MEGVAGAGLRLRVGEQVRNGSSPVVRLAPAVLLVLFGVLLLVAASIPQGGPWPNVFRFLLLAAVAVVGMEYGRELMR